MTTLCRVLLGARPVFSVGLARAGVSSFPTIFHKQTLRTSSKPLLCEVTTLAQKTAQLENEDHIHRDLIGASSTNDLLELIKAYHSTMTNKHLLTSFEILGCKVEAGEAPRNITDSMSFLLLANRTLRRVRFLDLGDCITLLKAASLLKVPASSSLVQGICQMIRSSMSQLSIQQLIFLNFLLTRFEDQTPLTSALNTAIPIIFQAQCPLQLDTADRAECYRALKFALSAGCDKQTLGFISSALQRDTRGLSTQQVIRLISTVSFIKAKRPENGDPLDAPQFKQLFEALMDMIAADLHSLDETNLRSLLYSLTHAGCSKNLYDALWRFAIGNKWNLAQTIMLAVPSHRHQFFTVKYAKFLRDLIIEEENEVLRNDRIPLHVLSRVMALLIAHDHCSEGGNPSANDTDANALNQKALSILAGATEKAVRLSNSQVGFVAYMRDLASVKMFPTDQLEVLFNEGFQKILINNEFTDVSTLLNIFDIEQYVRLLYQSNKRSDFRLLPKLRSQILRRMPQVAMNYEQLHQDLAAAFGGDEFVAEGVLSRLGTRVDYLLAMLDDAPVAIYDRTQKKIKPLKELPPGSKVAAIVVANEASYLRGSGLPTLDLSVRVELLRLQNMNPVVINVQDWMTLPEHEKKPFILRDLKKALGTGQAYASVKIDAI